MVRLPEQTQATQWHGQRSAGMLEVDVLHDVEVELQVSRISFNKNLEKGTLW